MVNTLDRIHAHMVDSPYGHHSRDVDKLLRGFGFRARKGKNKTIYKHPSYPSKIISVQNHGKVRFWVIKDVLKLLE